MMWDDCKNKKRKKKYWTHSNDIKNVISLLIAIETCTHTVSWY